MCTRAYIGAFGAIIKDLIDKYENNDLDDDGNLIFLDASKGTGKTFLLSTIKYYVRMKDKNVATSASLGIAANILYIGRTTHKRFNLPFHFD